MEKSQLNKEQQQAVSHINGPMLVLAGPGSGKTHILIERVVSLIENGINPDNILVITFSKKAAQEMEIRFKKRTKGNFYPVSFGTFHAVFFNILKNQNLYNSNSILTNKEKLSIITEAASIIKLNKSNQKSYLISTLEKISAYKNMGENIFSSSSYYFFNDEEIDEFKKLYKEYISLCSLYNKLDFDDMIEKCIELFNDNNSIRKLYQDKYKYILIDEFQDINKSQYEMIRLLEGSAKNVFVVGDDDQSIYGFRGALPDIVKLFVIDHEGCKRVNLLTNYRCCYEIIEAADKSIRHNKNRIIRQKQQSINAKGNGRVTILNFDNESSEGDYVCAEITQLKQKGFNNFAIIYRSEHCVNLIEEKLKQSGINYSRKNRAYDFYMLESIRIIISYFKVAIDAASLEDYLLILNSPPRDLSRNALIGFKGISRNDYFNTLCKYYNNYNKIDTDKLNKIFAFKQDIELMSELPLIASFYYLLKKMGLYNYLNSIYKKHPSKSVEFNELMDELENRLKIHTSIEGFLGNVNQNSENEVNNTNNREIITSDINVTFLTAHASKGLEFDVVFVCGLQEGLFPHVRNLKEPGIEEERRLFYVALTRAKQYLYLLSRGSIHGKIPSRFVSEICDQSFIASNSSLSRNSSNASATASYSSSSSMYSSVGSTLGSDSSS